MRGQTYLMRTQAPRGRTCLPRLSLLLSIALLGACAPELGDDPVPAYFEFDPTTQRVPLPNVILQSQETGRLDYGLPNDPAFCDTITSMPPAMCEFMQYMQTMNGFPSQSTVSVPVIAELELTTLTADNLVVFALAPEQGIEKMWDATTSQLVLASPDSWDVGKTYVVAIRGYDNGVRTVDGDRVVAPTAYSLLKREESLINCEPDPPDPTDLVNPVVDRSCKYFALLAQDFDPEDPADGSALMAVEAQLVDLERLRQGFLAQGLWEATRLVAQMPKEEVAMVFAFPIHSGPVVELDPDKGKVPEIVDANTIRMAVNGDLDPATVVAGLTPFTPANGSQTVALLNVTKLAENNLIAGLPSFDATVVGGGIQLTTDAPMIVGDRYVIVLATVTPFSTQRSAITNLDGDPMVPSAAVAMLKALNPVYDEATGMSNVSVFTADKAQELEANRLVLMELLDDDLFPLDRDQVGYVFGFDMVVP